MLQLSLTKPREADDRANASKVQKATNRWLQTVYPRDLAVGLRDKIRRRGPEYGDVLRNRFRETLANNYFERSVFVRELWDVDWSLLVRYGHMRPPDGGPLQAVRCGAPLNALLGDVVGTGIGETAGNKDPLRALYQLLETCLPGSATRVFKGSRALPGIMHQNEYVLEKAFVHCVYYLSKCLGTTLLPQGIHYAWPPPTPQSALPVQTSGVALTTATAPDSAASSSSAAAASSSAVSSASAAGLA